MAVVTNHQNQHNPSAARIARDVRIVRDSDTRDLLGIVMRPDAFPAHIVDAARVELANRGQA